MQTSMKACYKLIKKKLEMKLIFCMQTNIKISYNLISILSASKILTRWYYHSCWAWSSILKVLKVKGLQYLYNISKKEFRKGVHFLHADEHQSFYKWRLWLLMEVARYVQSTQNRKLIIFLQRVLQLLLYSIVMQNIQIFYGGPAMLIVTCFLAQPNCWNFLPKHCNPIIMHQLCGEGLPFLFNLLQADVFKRSKPYCSKWSHAHQTSQKRLLSGLVIQIISPEVLQESTIILQLKVYIVYVMRKLIGPPP